MDMDRVCITPTSMCLGVVGRGKATLETAGTTCPELTSLEKTKREDGIRGNMQSHPKIMW